HVHEMKFTDTKFRSSLIRNLSRIHDEKAKILRIKFQNVLNYLLDMKLYIGEIHKNILKNFDLTLLMDKINMIEKKYSEENITKRNYSKDEILNKYETISLNNFFVKLVEFLQHFKLQDQQNVQKWTKMSLIIYELINQNDHYPVPRELVKDL